MYYQKLFDYMSNEHGVTLLEQDMQEICIIVNEMQATAKPNVSGELPSVDDAGIAAIKISEKVEPKLTAQEQAYFIAGFCECIKWINSTDR